MPYDPLAPKLVTAEEQYARLSGLTGSSELSSLLAYAYSPEAAAAVEGALPTSWETYEEWKKTAGGQGQIQQMKDEYLGLYHSEMFKRMLAEAEVDLEVSAFEIRGGSGAGLWGWMGAPKLGGIAVE